MTNHIFQRHNAFTRGIASWLLVVFTASAVFPPSVSAQMVSSVLPALPLPGHMVKLSGNYRPAFLKGVIVHPENPFRLDFIVDKGDSNLQGQALEKEISRLVKYFLAALTTPEEEIWVNLSPHERNRIVPEAFGTTEMGRDLLAQDYLLKQLTASLTYPDEKNGDLFWKNVYQKAREQFGTTQLPFNTFNKVWILPKSAYIFEKENKALLLDSQLRIMLEKDFVALEENRRDPRFAFADQTKDEADAVSTMTSNLVRQLLIPEIEKEVNHGKNFATLRQIYSALVLAHWYKERLKNSIFARLYADQNKVEGIDIEDKAIKEKIYNQYLEAFRKGVYNYIKEEVDPSTQEVVPTKYFSGGFTTGAGGLDSATTMNANEALVPGGLRGKLQSDDSDLASIDLTPIPEGQAVGPKEEAALAQAVKKDVAQQVSASVDLSKVEKLANNLKNSDARKALIAIGDAMIPKFIETIDQVNLSKESLEEQVDEVLTQTEITTKESLDALLKFVTKTPSFAVNQAIISAKLLEIASKDAKHRELIIQALFGIDKRVLFNLAQYVNEHPDKAPVVDEFLKSILNQNPRMVYSLSRMLLIDKKLADFLLYMKQLVHWIELMDDSVFKLIALSRLMVNISNDIWIISLHQEEGRLLDNEMISFIGGKVIALYLKLKRDGVFQSQTKDMVKFEKFVKLMLKVSIDARPHAASFVGTSEIPDLRVSENNYDLREKVFISGFEETNGIFQLIPDSNLGEIAQFIEHLMNEDLDADVILRDMDKLEDNDLRASPKIETEVMTAIGTIKQKMVGNLWAGYQEAMQPVLDELKSRAAAQAQEKTDVASSSNDDWQSHGPRSPGRSEESAVNDSDLSALRQLSTQELIAMLRDSNDSGDVQKAGSVLIERKNENDFQVIPSLISLLKEDKYHLRIRSIEVLGRIAQDNKAAIDELVNVLFHDKSYLVIRSTIESLGKIISATGVEEEIAVLDDLIKIDFNLNSNSNLGNPEIEILNRVRVKVLATVMNKATDRQMIDIKELFKKNVHAQEAETQHIAIAGLVMTGDKQMLSSFKINDFFSWKTISFLFEFMNAMGKKVDYLDEIFKVILNQRKSPDVHLSLMNAIIPAVDDRLFQPFVNQIFHWLELKEGLTPQERLEAYGQMGLLIAKHVWRIGLESEENSEFSYLDNKILVNIASRFVSQYLQIRQSVKLIQNSNFDKLMRLIVRVVLDSRLHMRRYVKGRGEISNNFGMEILLELSKNHGKQEIEGLIAEIKTLTGVDQVLENAKQIKDERFPNLEQLSGQLGEVFLWMRQKLGNDIWINYDNELNESLKEFNARVAAQATNEAQAQPDSSAQSPVAKSTDNRSLITDTDTDKTPGGIDFNPRWIDMKIRRDESGMPLSVESQPIEELRMKIKGVVPVIINVTPVTDLPLLLGISTEIPAHDHSETDLSFNFYSRDPQDLVLVS